MGYLREMIPNLGLVLVGKILNFRKDASRFKNQKCQKTDTSFMATFCDGTWVCEQTLSWNFFFLGQQFTWGCFLCDFLVFVLGVCFFNDQKKGPHSLNLLLGIASYLWPWVFTANKDTAFNWNPFFLSDKNAARKHFYTLWFSLLSDGILFGVGFAKEITPQLTSFLQKRLLKACLI